MTEQMLHPFARSGIAARSDLETPEWRDLFSQLETEQESFLAKEQQFRSPEYQWPRDALHNWSRVWEYPYIYFHLQKQRERLGNGRRPLLVDVGTGVTFFPFAVARLGYDLVCTDIDPTCIADLRRAEAVCPHAPGTVQVRRIEGDTLPVGDAEADAVSCISVLEHVPQCDRTIAEMARILKPGGVLLLTIDLDLRGDSEIGPQKHRDLIQSLNEFFSPACPETTVHPLDSLNTCNSNWPIKVRAGWQRKKFVAKQRIRSVLGRQPNPLVSVLLTVQGLVLSRNE
jgi:SAM-dependent methyltransferase